MFPPQSVFNVKDVLLLEAPSALHVFCGCIKCHVEDTMMIITQTWDIVMLLNQVSRRSFTPGSHRPKSQVGFVNL